VTTWKAVNVFTAEVWHLSAACPALKRKSSRKAKTLQRARPSWHLCIFIDCWFAFKPLFFNGSVLWVEVQSQTSLL